MLSIETIDLTEILDRAENGVSSPFIYYFFLTPFFSKN